MIRSQVVVLNVIYDDETYDAPMPSKPPPSEWNWSELVDEPIPNAVELLAAGPVKKHALP